MILSMSAQVKLFLYTVAIGTAVGVIYDVIRLFRRQVKHSGFFCSIEDLIYWIFVSIVMFYFMLNKNYGEIRLFSIIGFFAGMLMYFLTVSFFVLKALMLTAGFLKSVILAMLKILLFPIKILLGILKIPFGIILSFLGKRQAKAKKLLQKSKRYAKIKRRKLLNDINIILKKV